MMLGSTAGIDNPLVDGKMVMYIAQNGPRLSAGRCTRAFPQRIVCYSGGYVGFPATEQDSRVHNFP